MLMFGGSRESNPHTHLDDISTNLNNVSMCSYLAAYLTANCFDHY